MTEPLGRAAGAAALDGVDPVAWLSERETKMCIRSIYKKKSVLKQLVLSAKYEGLACTDWRQIVTSNGKITNNLFCTSC